MTATENLLELRGITKRFAGGVALEDVDLTLRRHHILALLGENGAGKSTLMKILSGVHRPDAGVIRLAGREVALRRPEDAQALGIGIIYQEFSLVPHLSVLDNLFFGRERTSRLGVLAPEPMRRDAQAALARLGAEIPLETHVARLSVAEQQCVEIAKALLRQTRLLIMDEPTATLTPPEVQRLFAVMRELRAQGISIIFISHHLDEIFAIADDVLCLRDGRSVGERPVAGCSRAELICLMVGRDVAQTSSAKLDRPAGEIVLDVRVVQRKTHRPAVSFQVRAGEILGIAGLVGSGRTKLVRALVGADRAHRYDVRLDGRPLKIAGPADARAAGIGLAPEDRQRQGLVLDASVQDNLLLAHLRKVCHPRWRWLRPTVAAAVTRDLIRDLQIKVASPAQRARLLSGGNQQKIVLAKWLHAGCRVLIFDEPTRGIDVGAKAEIYRLMRRLAAEGLAIVMISSELPEVMGMSDRILIMRAQRIATSSVRASRRRPRASFSMRPGIPPSRRETAMTDPRRAKFGDWLTQHPEALALAGLVALCVAMSFVSDRFLSWDNFSNLGRQASINAILATGMTLVILTGGIDLSVRAVMALSVTSCAGAMLAGLPVVVGVLAGLGTGVVFGALNGALVGYVRLPPIIVTLATMEIPRGIALLYTGGYPQSGLPPAFAFLGRGEVLGVQMPVVIAVAGAAFVLLRYFPTERYFYGLGGNEEAVRLSGVRVERYKFLAYVLSGLTASIGGLVLASRLMSGQPNAGMGFELDAIAAVVLGGTSITGGRGSIVGTVIGALTLGVLNNGLNLMGVSPYTQMVLKGVIILLAIYAGTLKRSRT
jgi:ribose transport system ATP-binding protein